MFKTCLSLLLLFFSFISPVSAARTPTSQIDFNTLDTVITAQMSKHGLPGVALAVIENGEIVYLKAYGVDGNGRPLTPQTQMFIGSQSKSFTALAIAQLVEQGQLDLNAPVHAYIPWFRVADETASGQITLNHLLHHTSGLSDSGFGVLIPDNASLEQSVRALSAAQLTAPVGSKHQYFNLGYSVLAYLVELASGQTYAEYVQIHILTPLGMDSSTAAPSTAPNIPPGHTRLFGFPLPAQENAPLYGIGAGWIISTAADMARYAIAFQNGGKGLVSPETMKRILTPGTGNYGLGWYIYDNGAKIVHGGANLTFRTEVNLYPRQNRAFILLTNQGYQVDHFISADQLTNSVEAFVLGYTPPLVSEGWSVQWMGWGLGIFVLALSLLHTRNFLSLRGWRERTRSLPAATKAWDVAISFLIPSAILLIVFWQVSSFYGDRFNIWTNLTYMRFGLPDVFILMLVGILPDYIQGFIKVYLWQRG
ncbi:MAG TPA: serine hydrolase domain-containing protein [Levilinea sp.]|nr:serine hydrolase domain-containing protein [Levilinea sp.]